MNNLHKQKIVFISFFNNYSGSPNILSIVARGFIEKGYPVEIITNRSEGFLSNIVGARYNYVFYKWSNCKICVILFLLIAQLQLFVKLIFSSKSNTLYYINTVSPVGAVWACKITRKSYVYHVHENMQRKGLLYRIYKWTYQYCNTKSIFVSHYLEECAVCTKNSKVIYNCLGDSFTNISSRFYSTGTGNNILMIASLKKYKGVFEFIELAKLLPDYTFELVLSASDTEVDKLRSNVLFSRNLTVYSTQSNTHSFYQRARILLQLSHPSFCVETFGLTILEAMSYGVPSIVPNVGGPLELIQDGVNGFTIDPLNMEILKIKVNTLMQDQILYRSFSQASLENSKKFDRETMITQIEEYLFA